MSLTEASDYRNLPQLSLVDIFFSM